MLAAATLAALSASALALPVANEHRALQASQAVSACSDAWTPDYCAQSTAADPTACDVAFCASCPFASKCDKSCGLCQTDSPAAVALAPGADMLADILAADGKPDTFVCTGGQCVPNARGIPLAQCQLACAPAPHQLYTCQSGQVRKTSSWARSWANLSPF